ncbi:MAG: hypothetical protein ABUL60_09710 [Myxococcales bacterium]
MSFLKPKFVLLALAGTLLPAFWTSGCSGGAFTADDAAAAGTSSSGGKGSSGANSGGASDGGDAAVQACDGPEDCDDKNVCTTDRCNADGTCDASPKCPGADKCCNGDCAECCENTDCEDGLDCTTNTCFSGQCMFVPNDAKCDSSEYCAANDGCVVRKACTGLPGEAATVCDDNAACTVDSCEGNFCHHSQCPDPSAKLCCEGKGCAECCNDSQCDDHKDPCMVGSCQDGKCSKVPRCGKDQQCCPSADGQTATCGKCCSANECDDKVGCTVDKCGGGQCSNTPQAEQCGAGFLCDPSKGCVKAPVCTTGSDCRPATCQSNPRCDGGACFFDGCAAGTHCCANGCAACCSAEECNDNIPCTKDGCGAMGCTHTPDDSVCGAGHLCNVSQGCVAGCKADDDCQVRVVTAAVPIGTNPCVTSKCVKGQCQDTTIDCGDFQTCCNGACTLPNQCLQTQ